MDEESYDPACLKEVKARLADYIHKGARTKLAAARITVPALASPDPTGIGGRRVHNAACGQRMKAHLAQEGRGKRRLREAGEGSGGRYARGHCSSTTWHTTAMSDMGPSGEEAC